jgi:hypothetical protein
MKKLRMIKQLDDNEQNSFFNTLDSLVAKKRLTETLSNTLKLAH